MPSERSTHPHQRRVLEVCRRNEHDLRDRAKVLADRATRARTIAHIEKLRMEGTWGP